jgi:hypothetical protein
LAIALESKDIAEYADSMKLLIITAEVHKMLPGQGQGIFRKLLAAKWIAPCTPTVRPLYRSADVLACLARLEAGEVPVPIYRWQSCLGSDRPVSHLLPLNGTKAHCGKSGEWMQPANGAVFCSRCQGALKTVTLETP